MPGVVRLECLDDLARQIVAATQVGGGQNPGRRGAQPVHQYTATADAATSSCSRLSIEFPLDRTTQIQRECMLRHAAARELASPPERVEIRAAAIARIDVRLDANPLGRPETLVQQILQLEIEMILFGHRPCRPATS